MENKITLQEIQRELVRLNAHYPEAMMGAEVLYSISEDYYESFSHWTFERFKANLKTVRETCKFWPKIVDLQKADSENQRHKLIGHDWRSLPNGKACGDCEFIDRCKVNTKQTTCTQGISYSLFSEKADKLVEELDSNT